MPGRIHRVSGLGNSWEIKGLEFEFGLSISSDVGIPNAPYETRRVVPSVFFGSGDLTTRGANKMKNLKDQLVTGMFALMIAVFAVGCSSKSDTTETDGFAMGASETSMESTEMAGGEYDSNLGAASSGRGR